jgi:hypothetical protein
VVEVGNSIRMWAGVETYFLRHEHDSRAVAILRPCICFKQATMAVIILAPPYSFAAVHSYRPDSRLFYSRALKRLLIHRAAAFNSQGQSEDFRST